MTRRSTAAATALAFLATIPAANWLIGNVGTYCVPEWRQRAEQTGMFL